MTEIWRLDATAQAELIRTGDLTPVEAVSAALGRIDATAELHAVTTTLADRALRHAVDASGPFAGVPIVLKDAGQELAGTPLAMGTTVLAEYGYISPTTTELAHQLEAMGFVIVAKSAVPELMSGISTEPPTGRPTGNPWATDRTAGGSSGGSAAAVAAGIVPVAHGSDSTGSLRFPASCCGVLTLKPTAGRISSRLPAGVANPGGSHSDFIFARSTRDLQRVFEALAVPPVAEPSPLRRIGVLDEMPFGLPIDGGVEQAVADVSEQLVEVGISVEPVSPTFLENYGAALADVIPTIVDAHRSAVVSWVEDQIRRPVVAGDLSDAILAAAERGRHLAPAAVDEARSKLRAAALRAAAWTSDVDGLLMPILDTAPWPNGAEGSDGRLGGLVCSVANFSGQPSVVVPTVQGALPIGVQVQAASGRDEALMSLIAALAPHAPASPYLTR